MVIGDVGESFGGTTLSMAEYLRIESLHIEVARLVLEEADVRTMRATEVAHTSIASAAAKRVSEEMVVPAAQALEILRQQIRGELSCHLEAENGVSMDLGFDFYLYISSPMPIRNAVRQAVDLGLFVEEDFPSPFLNP